jgi:hypothetical protein
VHSAAHLDRAGPAGSVDRQSADVVGRGDQPGRAAGERRAEHDVQPDRVIVQAIEEPQFATAGVDDAPSVSAGMARVPAVMVSVPAQAGAVGGD